MSGIHFRQVLLRLDAALVVTDLGERLGHQPPGVAAAAALPELNMACGLGTGSLFTEDVAPAFVPSGGVVGPRWFTGDDVVIPDAVRAGASRERWWRDRLARCHAVLAG